MDARAISPSENPLAPSWDGIASYLSSHRAIRMWVLDFDFDARSICIATPKIFASRLLPVADPNDAAGSAPALQLLLLRAV